MRLTATALALTGALVIGLVATPSLAAPIGLCKFDAATMTFAGAAQQQAACLLRRVKPKGGSSVPQPVPQWLLDRVGAPIDLTKDGLVRYLAQIGAEASDLGGPIALGDIPAKRYFVIHDTSSPEIANRTTFPADLNEASYAGNTLNGWVDTSKRVNLIISRDGRSRTFRDWSADRPLPATKLEQNNVLPRARRVFVHVENIQPRIDPPDSWAWIAPDPGFAPAQSRRLALAYVVASVRAGRWLIPALHYNIDKDGPAGQPHDDPQGFDLAAWVANVQSINEAIRAGDSPPPPTPPSSAPPSPAPPAIPGATGNWPAWVRLDGLADVSEDYRAQFGLCDSANRFRGLTLPATIAGKKYFGCTSDKNRVSALKRLPVPGQAKPAVVFTSKLSVDLDGSWFACNTPGHTDQCETSLMPRNSANVAMPVSSDFVPYVVIPAVGPTTALAGEFRNLTEVRVGDFGVVLTASDAIPVIVADSGPFPKLGEGSIALHRRIGRELCATKDPAGRCKTVASPLGSADGPFVTILFPGSRMAGLKAEQVAETTRTAGTRLWNLVRAQLGR